MSTDVGYIRTHSGTRSLGVSMRTLCDGNGSRMWQKPLKNIYSGKVEQLTLAKAAASFDVYAFEGRPPSDLNYNIKRNNTVNIHIVPETVDENWKLSTQLELDLLNEEGDKGPLALIKDDCEGCEFHFLEGAKKVLQKYHPVMIIEIKDDESPRNAKEGGQRKIKQTKTREDVLNWLANDLGCIVESMRDDDGAET
ncbi:hypothetical protein ACHAXR_012310 [Thalassiosira sp. AJA248-18]